MLQEVLDQYARPAVQIKKGITGEYDDRSTFYKPMTADEYTNHPFSHQYITNRDSCHILSRESLEEELVRTRQIKLVTFDER